MDNNQFVGKYVQDIRDVLIASLVSGENVVLVGEPGTGKTTIALDVANHVYPKNQVLFLQLDGSTPPEAVKGLPDPAKLLDSPPSIEIVLKGSVFDPDMKVIILDEFGRPLDLVFDVLVHGLNRSLTEGDKAPVFWGTTNFINISARTEAMADRVLLWLWVDTGKIKVKDVVKAALGTMGLGSQKLTVGDHLPTPEEIENVRNMIPGKSASRAIIDVIDSLVEEIYKSGKHSDFAVNNRRITQWSRLLFRTAAYYSQDPDFSSMPVQALNALRFAQVSTSKEDFNEWGKIVASIADVVGTALNKAAENAFIAMRNIINTVSLQEDRSKQLGYVLAQSEEDLTAVAESSNDPRVEEYLTKIRNAYGEFVRGRNPSTL